MSISINKNINSVVIAQPAASLIITDNRKGTTVTVSRTPDIITVTNLSGLQGPKGDTGPQGPAGLTAQTGSFFISASVANAVITFTKGDASTSSVTVNNVVSASYALTASYALNGSGLGFPFSGSAVITGSLEIKSNVNNIFIIKNFDNQHILTVSQSGVIIIATQSIDPIGTAPNGSIYFTSSSFFVGLD